MLLLGALLSFPVGILANILTPWLQKRAERGTRKPRLKTRDRLVAELELVTALHDHPAKLAARSVQSFGLAFVFYIAGNFVWALPLWPISDLLSVGTGLLADLLFVIAALLIMNHLKLVSKTIRFDKFRADALQRISFAESIT